jgi:hypothetical protein
MTIQRTTAILLLATIAVISCTKNPVTGNSSDYLKFSNATLPLTNKQGARGAVMVESNIKWQLSIEGGTPNWMTANKLSGSNSDSLIVTATMDNNTGGYKFANIIATAVNNSSILPVRVTVVQYDSSYKGK